MWLRRLFSDLVNIAHHILAHTLAPSAPTIVSVEATSSTSISVQWNASKNDGGSPITGYVVEYRPTSNPSFETQVVARDVFSVTLDGLTPSTEYDVRVRGENAVGRSLPSATMRAKTETRVKEQVMERWHFQIALRYVTRVMNVVLSVCGILFTSIHVH